MFFMIQLIDAQELDWELTDIDGVSHHFFEELTPNRVGIIFFGATWSTTSWNAHESGVLEELYQIYGPTGEDILRIYFLESDQTTTLEDVKGTGTNTTGDWTASVSYPIFNLINGQVPSEYNISSTPTITFVDTSKMKAIHNLWGANFNVDYISDIIESYKVQSGFAELENVNAFILYPNPASQYLEIDYEKTDIQSIEIIDNIGRRVYFDPSSTINVYNSISLEGMRPGMYKIIISTLAGKAVKSFIKVE